jgi:hypothetical protein
MVNPVLPVLTNLDNLDITNRPHSRKTSQKLEDFRMQHNLSVDTDHVDKKVVIPEKFKEEGPLALNVYLNTKKYDENSDDFLLITPSYDRCRKYFPSRD